jgi:hypothetical protein
LFDKVLRSLDKNKIKSSSETPRRSHISPFQEPEQPCAVQEPKSNVSQTTSPYLSQSISKQRFSATQWRRFQIANLPSFNISCPKTPSLTQDAWPQIPQHQQQHQNSKMITREVQSCNMGRGAYDTTGVPKPPPPKPR